VEEALRILAAALQAATEAGLDKVEVQRLQVVATLARTYEDLFADYVDYRGIEVELVELRKKYEDLVKKVSNPSAK
jgi:maleate cis-trans isomerase